METSSPLPDTQVSLLRAIDGSHLRWSDFRMIVLSAFRIIFTDSLQLSELSRPFSDRLRPCLQNLDRFNNQESEWRMQVASNKGFGSSMVFPPNVLPTTGVNLTLHRSLAPKLNREALPPRAVKAQESLFELPVPRPGLLTGFTTQAFNERELSVLPHCTSAIGTIVDFESGTVSPGTTTYCPFLVFERMNTTSEDAVQSAKNQCAIAGAHCVRALQLLFRKCTGPRPVFEKPISFSCAINNSTALVYYHYVDGDGRYCMSELSRFNLDDAGAFKEFQGWIEAIEDWGSTYLLPVIKIALRQLLKSHGTPPISPMPSLTLSIDTAAGGEEVLMKVLRSTFGAIKWKCEGECETPLNSSIAHCGTPLGARKIRTLALSPTSPVDILGAVSGPTTPFSVWRMRPDWSSRSPTARRHPLSPLKLRADIPDSPCRRATLSPCTPPPEAPNSAQSPMLVLQKRVNLAMDEIQELRALVQTLQGELESKNNQLELRSKTADSITSETCKDAPSTPTAGSAITLTGRLERSIFPLTRPPFNQIAASLLFSRLHLPWTLFLFLLVLVVLSHDIFETAFHLVQTPGTAFV
ncbi:uncharacterized protein Z520_11557 [Fonsecaea multimorphosa CBS 102226]|uniref:DUF7924 domain-containing protein n=1 Tax=Fonsecaea multimorphosa CBS 102226 TaxID=1442371 RepID=A0A0D2GTA2_9EURO|nr:uncharacterized protein Z520_11557 [Fonsecaea multimorphosa CBS 102226]KIX92705.1 hypothetical protein Z520_11557 [Fonsecaea multimorphosa CBS 102226]OAL17947.1 hypothetical protein AYO22_11103 [Fonsecaea multimorphosa]